VSAFDLTDIYRGVVDTCESSTAHGKFPEASRGEFDVMAMSAFGP
jgi:hypothetical protein